MASWISMTKIGGAFISHVDKNNNTKIDLLTADYYVSAVPVNILNNIINTTGKSQILRYDPSLLVISQIVTLPATENKLFMKVELLKLRTKAWVSEYIAHPWELSLIPQTGYWANPSEYAGDYEVISIYIAITYAKGNLLFDGENLAGKNIATTKTMVECSPQEIAAEMFFAVETMLKRMYPNIKIPKRVGFF